MAILRLRCWSCGRTADVEGGTAYYVPSFAFEIADIANQIGWIGAIDLEHSRTLVFCSDGCSQRQKNARGSYFRRPKGINKEVTP